LSFRRVSEHQPSTFAFTPENGAWIEREIAKYPPDRQASAVIALLWRGQEQEGWVSKPMIEDVACRLDMPFIRVLEVATFYTMFNLAPVGRHLVQVCTTTPCWLAGSDEVVAACRKHIAPKPETISSDGMFSWMEVECLGACVNAPVMQIGKGYYEDLDAGTTETIFSTLRRGERPKTGSQSGRHSSEPAGGRTTLTDRSIYDGTSRQAGPAISDAKLPSASGSDRESPAQQPPGVVK
jgi:NADH-quinone oxidoreductase subunit E